MKSRPALLLGSMLLWISVLTVGCVDAPATDDDQVQVRSHALDPQASDTAAASDAWCEPDTCARECASGSGETGTCVDDTCVCQGCAPAACTYACTAARWDGGSCIDDACICWG